MKRALILCALAGCTQPRTELILGIATDLRATNDLDGVHLTLSVDDVPFHEEDWTITGAAGMPFNLPGSFGIYRDGDHDRVQIKLTGLRAGAPVVVREAVLGFVDGKTTFYRMGLTSSCMANTCPAGQTCVEGACKPRELDPTMFPGFRDDLVTTLSCSTPGTPGYLDTASGQAMPLAKDAAACPGALCSEGTCLVPPSGGKTFKGVLGGAGIVDLTVDGSKITATMMLADIGDATALTAKCSGTVDGSVFSATCDQPVVIDNGVITGDRLTALAHDTGDPESGIQFTALAGADVQRYCGTFDGSESGSWSFVTGGGILTGVFDSVFIGGTLEGTVSSRNAQIQWSAGSTASGTAAGTVSDDGSMVNGTYQGTASGSPVSGTFTNSTASCADRL